MSWRDRRPLWKSGLLIFMLTALFACYLIFKPGGLSPGAVKLVDNVSQGLLEGFGLLLTLPLFLQWTGRRGVSSAARRAPTGTAQRLVPLLLGLGILSYVIGQAIWTYNEDIAHLAVLFPTWADAGYLGSFPLVLLALLVLPTQPVPAGMRARIVLNSLIIMVAVTTFSWYFVLGPTILQGAESVPGLLIGAAYPLATLVLIFCLLLLSIHFHDLVIRPVALILGLAFLIIVITDTIYESQQLHNGYHTGTLLDVGWPLGYMLVGLGAWALRVVMAARPLPEGEASNEPVDSEKESVQLISPSLFWHSLPPFLFLPAIVVLLGYIIAAGNRTPLEEGVFLGTALFVGLLILRQFFVIGASIRQNYQLWEMFERVIRAELGRERAERIKVERILALNEVLAASQKDRPHARIVAFGHYQIRSEEGIYFNVYHREAGEHQAFECECPQYQQQAICMHSLTAAALHSVSEPTQR
jgi:hypothetical protein